MPVRAPVRDAQRAIAALDANYRHAANRLERAIRRVFEAVPCCALRPCYGSRRPQPLFALQTHRNFLHETPSPDAHQSRANPRIDLLGCT